MREAASKTLAEIGPALLAAWVTSVAGFVAIGWSSVKALRDFSILGTLGLTGSYIAAATVLPALATLLGQRQGAAGSRADIFRFRMEGLLRWSSAHRTGLVRTMSAVALLAVAVALGPGGSVLQPEPDLSVMHPQPNAALQAQRQITRRFGAVLKRCWFISGRMTASRWRRLAHEAARRLSSPAVRKAGVAGTYGLATWLPDPKVVEQRAAQVDFAEADRVVADFNAAVSDSGFRQSAFEGYSQFLHDLLTRKTAPTAATLAHYPGLSRSLLPRDPAAPLTEAVTIIFLDHPTEDRAVRDAVIDAVGGALKDLPGATLSGLPVVGHDAETAVWRELPRLLLAAMILVAGYLLLHFRDIRDMALSLLPAAFGLAALAAIVRLAGVKLNMVNLVALPLLIGIDVDYGIYLVTLARRGRSAGDAANPNESIASGAHAVLVCATSMIAGYASLAFTSIPAMRSLGLVVAAGVASCACGALLFLCPMLLPRRSG